MTKYVATGLSAMKGVGCLAVLLSPIILVLWGAHLFGKPEKELRLTDLYQTTWTTEGHKHIGTWRGEDLYTDNFRYQEIRSRDAAGELQYEVQAVTAANVWHNWMIQEIEGGYLLRCIGGRIVVLKEDGTPLVTFDSWR